MRHTRSFFIGAVLAATALLAACDDGQVAPPASVAAPASSSEAAAVPSGEAPAAPNTKVAAPAPARKPAKAPATSDLSGLRITGIKAGKGVLIDVVDDGEDRFLAVGEDGQVGFTGTGMTDATMMALHPAAVSAANRVVIKPPFFNEEVGGGYCVAGDSGLFELHGADGVISVGGRTGLQVLPYAE